MVVVGGGKIYGSEDYGFFSEGDVKEILLKGGNRWTKYGKDRLYLSELAETVGGFKYEMYRSGNISYAEINGKKISNSQASRILASLDGAYIDLTDGSIVGIKSGSGEVGERIKKYIIGKRRKTKK